MNSRGRPIVPANCNSYRVIWFTGNKAYLQFYLSNYTNTQSLENAVRNISYCDENTNTTGALRLTRTEIFITANGDRVDVPNVIVLLTDGNPTWETDLLSDEVDHIKRLGVRIVGVGVTNKVSDCPLLLCPAIVFNKHL